MRYLLLLALGTVCAVTCGDPGCGNEVVARYPSPDGALDAVVFDRNCGATTSLSRQVDIVSSGEEPSGAGEVLVLARTAPVTATWIRGRGLSVAFPPAAEARQQRSDVEGVHIVFEPLIAAEAP